MHQSLGLMDDVGVSTDVVDVDGPGVCPKGVAGILFVDIRSPSISYVLSVCTESKVGKFPVLSGNSVGPPYASVMNKVDDSI